MHAFTHVAVSWALPGIIAASALGALVMCLLVFKYGFPPAGGVAGAEGRHLVTRLGHAFAGTCFAVSAMLAVVALSQPIRGASAVSGPVVADTSALQAEVEGLRRQIATLEARLGRSETRLGAAESRVAAGEGRNETAASRADGLETRVRATEVALRQVNADTDRALAAIKQQLNTRPAATPAPVRRPAPALTSTPPARAPAPTATAPPSASPPSESAVRRAPELTPQPASPRAARVPEATATPAPTASADRPLMDKLRDDWQEIKRDTKTASEELDRTFRRVRGFLRFD